MRISYNLEALKKLSNEDLEKVFSDKTKPTLSAIFKKINRKATKKSKK